MTSVGMQVSVEDRGDVTVVRIAGSMDGTTASDLMARFNTELARGRVRLVGSLAEVGYTSSAGLRVLLAVLKDTRSRGGDFRLAGIQDTVRRVLELSGFHTILKIYPDVDTAVASFGGTAR